MSEMKYWREEGKITPFRALAARANYLAADGPEFQYAAKEACRWMAEPTEMALQALKRFGRYLMGKPRLVWEFPWQESISMDAYTDTDLRGNLRVVIRTLRH